MYKLKFESPASVWTESILLGNGKLGASVYGGIDVDTIHLNCDTLWSGTPRNEDQKTPNGFLDKARRLVLDGKYVEAEKYVAENIPMDVSASYLPMGTLTLRNDHYFKSEGYSRELNISDATATVVSTPERKPKEGPPYLVKKYWISKPHDVMVCTVEANSHRHINFTINASSELDCSLCDLENGVAVMGRAPSSVKTWQKAISNPNEPTYKYESDDTVRFCYTVTALNNEGTCFAQNGNLHVRNTRNITLIIAAETDFVSYNEIPDKNKDLLSACLAKTERAIDDGIDRVYEEHVKDYKSLFDRVELRLGGEESDKAIDRRISEFDADNPDLGLVELLFHYGRYLMIASSREGSQPTTLQGIWNYQLVPEWKCNYTVNINTQMNYWMAEQCGLHECHKPLLKMIEELADAGENTAKNIYNCRGFTLHHNTDLWRKTTPSEFPQMRATFWPMSGVWLCSHLWQSYEYSRDLEYLKNTVFPISEKAARFLLDYMTEDNNGHLVTAPSTSPENRFLTSEGYAGVCYASGMDMSLVGELFNHLVKARDILGVKSEIADEAEAALKKLRPFGIDSLGRLMEWNEEFEEPEKGHRHVSHLYGVFPGDLIKESDTELFEAAKKSLEYRLAHGGGYTGWSCAWITCLMAIFGDADGTWKCISKFFSQSTYPNLLDAHPPFQIDGNFGMPMGILSMLIKEVDGEPVLLPALPQCIKNGEVKGLRLTNNRSISFKWENGKVIEKTIINE